MQSRAIVALSGAILAITPVNSGLAQKFGDLLPPPSTPGSFKETKLFRSTSPSPGASSQPGGAVNSTPLPLHDGWGGYATGPIERSQLAAPSEAVHIQSRDRHFELETDLPSDEEYLNPGTAEEADKFNWQRINEVSPDGDFARNNSAEKQIGWVARGKNNKKTTLRRPSIDLKEMTRLKLNKNGSTVFDITKGAVITRF